VENKTLCRTPTPGKKPTRIDTWKFKIIRTAILEILSKNGDGIFFKDLANLVKEKIPHSQLNKIGSLKWYTICVKLEMEVRNEIIRIPKSQPQQLLKQID